MIGAIVGAAIAAGSALYSGIMSGKANRQAKANKEKQKAENTAWYNRRINEDGMQRADAQRTWRKAQEAITNRNKNAAATQAVVGGTEESVAATKEANANALAETASAINANAEARKDNIESSYRQQDANYNEQLNNLELQRSQNVANAGSQAIAAAGKIASALDTAGVGEGKSKSAQSGLTDKQKSTLDTQAQKGANNITLNAHQQLSTQMQSPVQQHPDFFSGKPVGSIFDVANAAN